MKSIHFFLIWLLVYSPSAFAYKVADIPGPLKENAHAVVRRDYTLLHINSPSSATLKAVFAITVLDKKGEEAARFSRYYSPQQTMAALTGKVYDAMGVLLTTLKMKDFGDVSAVDAIYSFGESRVKFFNPAYTNFPYTIEFSFEQTYNGIIAFPNWTPVNFDEISVEKSEFVVIHPKGMSLRMRQLNLASEAEVTQSYQDGTIQHRWLAENVPAFKSEPLSGDKRRYLPLVEVSPVAFEYGKVPGSMENWNEFGKWIYQLNVGRDQLPPEAVAEVLKLVEGAASDEEKARRIYAYMQSRSRYVSIQFGIGGFQSFPAEETHRLGYGDCKALTMYTKSLMQAAGVDAIYAVVYAGPRAKFYTDPAFPSQAFNHVILCLPFDGDTTWLECTSRDMPFGFLGDFTDDRYALLATENGGKLVKTTRYDQPDNLRALRAEVTISPVGAGDALLNYHWSGLQMDNRLSSVWFRSQTEHRNQLIKSFPIPKFELKEVDHSIRQVGAPALDERIHLLLPSYAAVTGKRLFIPLNLENRMTTPPVSKDRKNGFELAMAWVDRDTVVYHLPEGYQVEAQPAPVRIETPFGHYSSHVLVEGNTVTYLREVTASDGYFPADQYEAFFQFRKQMADADAAKLVLVKPE